MDERRGSLMYGEGQGIQVKLEKDAWSSLVVLQDPSIVCNTVLVGAQWLGTGGDIFRWNDVEEVLVRDKGLFCDFKSIVQWLRHIREMGAKREFGNDMGEIHDCQGA